MENLTPFSIFVGFIVTWGIGLLPPLLIRYAFLKRPTSKWTAIGLCGLFWFVSFIVYVALSASVKGHNALLLVAMVSYWILRKERSIKQGIVINSVQTHAALPAQTPVAFTSPSSSIVLADASVIDAMYEKIDQELQTENVDRATWTRAQGDAEGNVERAKALYIKYRAKRLFAANNEESGKTDSRFSPSEATAPSSPSIVSVEVKRNEAVLTASQPAKNWSAAGVISKITVTLVVLWMGILVAIIGWVLWT